MSKSCFSEGAGVRSKAFGGGFSYAIADNWILSADYLRYKLDSRKGRGQQTVVNPDGAALAIDSTVAYGKQDTTIDTFTARVSYKF